MLDKNVNRCLTEYYRCPERYVPVTMRQTSASRDTGSGVGYFLFGNDATCYGTCYGHRPAQVPGNALYDALLDVEIDDGTVSLPFDPRESIANLHRELYVREWRAGSSSVLASLYYFIRPLLSVPFRKYLQKFHLRNWDKLPFPRWPVDSSVDNLLERLVLLSLQATGNRSLPFIWFWPDGKSACAIMTHDVETAAGRDYCSALMDIDDSRGIKASIQVVPEQRYSVTPQFLQSIRRRGFEVVVHDLNHDGHLYKNRDQFLQRAVKINSYAKEFQSEGFRAAVLYRKQVWYDALECSFDMSVPNVAHLDPQRGGCCTVMPYFIGGIVELPVTTVQDYTLFNILNDYSTDLWRRQTALILDKHGLMSFIVHPDYVMTVQQRQVYEALLDHLVRLRQDHDVWITTPGEVNRWWRQRAQMNLVETDQGWTIEGPGQEHARVAWATAVDGQVVLTLDTPDGPNFPAAPLVSASASAADAGSPKFGMFSVINPE